MSVKVRFEYGQEGRMGEPIGPFDYVQMTYDGLWTPDREHEIAAVEPDGRWRTKDGQLWSDFVVYHETGTL